MNRNSRFGPPFVAALCFVLPITACSSLNDMSQSSGHASQPPESSSQTTTSGVATPGAVSTEAPAEASDFPDGVYRTQLSPQKIQQLGIDDPCVAGTNTLTVKSGTYRKDFGSIGTPACGESRTVEIGTLHGKSPTVWFVLDMAKLHKLNGCVENSEETDGCGPDDGYHLNWKKTSDGIAFSDYVGLGGFAAVTALNEWTVQPWTKIS